MCRDSIATAAQTTSNVFDKMKDYLLVGGSIQNKNEKL